MSSGGGDDNNNGGGGSGGCSKGPVADSNYMGYSAPRKPERDGEWTVQGDHIVVSKAPAKPVGCTANVQMPEAGKTYNWKEFFTMYGKAKLTCAGWDQQKHDHIKRKSVTNGNCSGAPYFTYDNLAMGAAMFPDFLGSDYATTNSLELAGFMANSSKETTGGWASEGYSGWGWCFGFEVGHPSGNYGNQDNLNNATCAAWGNQTATLSSSFKQASMNYGYFGRGGLQLSWCYNYGWFRNYVENYLGLPRTPERDFLANPGFVATEWPFPSALWFWMSPESSNNKPSMHSIINMWKPNGELSVDNAKRTNDFGYLPNILNGGYECGSGGHHGPKIRVDYMAEYMELMGVDTSQYQKHLQIDGGCVGKANMASQPFLYWTHPDGTKDGGDTRNRCS